MASRNVTFSLGSANALRNLLQRATEDQLAALAEAIEEGPGTITITIEAEKPPVEEKPEEPPPRTEDRHPPAAPRGKSGSGYRG